MTCSPQQCSGSTCFPFHRNQQTVYSQPIWNELLSNQGSLHSPVGPSDDQSQWSVFSSWGSGFHYSHKTPTLKGSFNTGANHIHINIGDASLQILAALNGSCVIAILPEGSFPAFADIIFLACSASYQLNWIRNHIPAARIVDQQVDMVWSNHIIQHTQTRISFPGLV